MERAIGAVAAGAGHVLRFLLFAMRVAFWSAGPLLVWYGVNLIYRPAGFIVAGLMVSVFALSLRPKRGAK